MQCNAVKQQCKFHCSVLLTKQHAAAVQRVDVETAEEGSRQYLNVTYVTLNSLVQITLRITSK